jgi:MATE family multidrug resistance protein
MQRIVSQWWVLLGLVLPMIASSLSDISMNFVDTAIVGHLGTIGLASVADASTIYSLVVETIAAGAIGYQIIAARQFGARNDERVSLLFSNAMIGLVLLATVGIVILWSGYSLVKFIDADPQVISGAVTFLRYRSPGLLFFAVAFLLTMTCQAARRTRLIMYVALVANIVNAALSYLLVFGAGPLPKMGIAGSALASSIADLCSLLLLGWVVFRKHLLIFERPAWRGDEITEMLRLSGPEILNCLLDYSGNLIFVFVVGLAGTAALAGGRIGFTLLIILFVVAMNFGIGIQILMGYSIGQCDWTEVRSRLYSGRILTAGVFAVLGVGLLFWPRMIAYVFTSSTPVVDFAANAILAVGVLAPLMAWTACHVGALRALGYTKWVLYSNVAAVWIVQLPLGWLVGIHLNFGLGGVYCGYIAYFLVRAIVSHYLARKGLAKCQRQTPFGSPATSTPQTEIRGN